MRSLLFAALLYFQSVQPASQNGTLIGHINFRNPESPAVAIRVTARAVDGGAIAVTTQTNETGGFRLEGVPPGRYYIAAGLTNSLTYFPGAADLKDAKGVTAVSGSTVIGIDFALATFADIPVAGRIVIEGGGALPLDGAGLIGSALAVSTVPNPAALVRVQARRFPNGTLSGVTVRGDGSFTLPLPPGEHQIAVQLLPLGLYLKSMSAGSVDLLQLPVLVSEGATPEIVVTLTRTPPAQTPAGVTVSGRVSGIPANTTSSPGWLILQSPAAGTRAVFGTPASVAEIPIQGDGRFEARGIAPGNYGITTVRPLAPLTQQSLVVPNGGLNGVELTLGAPRPTRGAPAGGAPTPAPVSLTTVRGKVDVFPGALMPLEIRLVQYRLSGKGQDASVSSDGAFAFTGIARGEYELRVGQDALSVARNFTVGNQDIAGMEIKSAVEARGRIAMADGSSLPSPSFKIQSEYAAGNPGNTRVLPTIQREFDVRGDGTFTLGVVKGEQRISVLGLPAAYSVKSIAYGSTDLLANPLSLDDAPVSEIVVTLESTFATTPRFSFVYQYGHDTLLQSNTLDTLRGTFTKDMVQDPPRTFNLRLTEAELEQIQKKMVDIDFWNAQKYPTVFAIPNPGPMGCSSTGRQPIFLLVTRGATSKELTWLDRDTVCALNQAGSELRSLMDLIRGIVESKPEYRRLPAARGMYID